MKLLIINGPNLNLLGIREPEVYGHKTYTDLVAYIQDTCREFGVDAEIFQSNCEGEIVTKIQQAYGGDVSGIIINPAAYTHTSIAILDALLAVGLPCVEVHLTDPAQRENFRRISYAGMACQATFSGQGFAGYRAAIAYFVKQN